MKITRTLFKFLPLIILLFMTLAFFTSCTAPEPQIPKLRVTNRGPSSVVNLTVWFPDEKINFGDISTGSTTDYQAVSNGVYRYAAYQYELGGELITQPVIDWVGEIPLDGDKFTYLVDFSATRPEEERVRLIEVTIDE